MKYLKKDLDFLELASLQAKQSLCLRKKVGVLIVNSKNEILIQTYNQNPYGLKNCIELNRCIREIRNIPSGMDYENTCPMLHAEQMAISSIGFLQCQDKIMYIFGHSIICNSCKKLILQARIQKVFLQENKNAKPICHFPKEWLNSLHQTFCLE